MAIIDERAETRRERFLDDISAGHEWRLGRFPELMPRRVDRILLVSSPYDSFILEEDGLLTELIFSEYIDLGLSHQPRVSRVSNAREAIEAIEREPFDLVISMLRLADMDIVAFTHAVKGRWPDLPLVVLAANVLELTRLGERRSLLRTDGLYVWQGDAKLFLAIIKVIEDRWNADHDTHVGHVGVIILVEDSVRYRSSLLPMLYSEIVKQTRSVMQEGLNRMHRLLRLRARPKILVAETYEEALELAERYHEYLFGIITDVRFNRGGTPDPQAGIELIKHLRREMPDLPVLFQSSDPANRALAEQVGASFLHKRSRTLLHDLRQFMLNNFGFGDFIFRTEDGHEVGRASNLQTMVRVLRKVPGESLYFHARRNHFSNWLRARTEFQLAEQLRPRKVSEFRDAEELREYLIEKFTEAIEQHRRGVVEDFDRQRFDPDTSFARIGGGSLGGKARGLAFFDALLARHGLDRAWDGVRVFVPRSVTIGTDVFDRFLEQNRLDTPALYSASDAWIRQAFLKAELPRDVVEDLEAYLERVRSPIAVRSSSLLEDSQYFPFAGVYDTYMLPNNDRDDDIRLAQLCDAVKLVYASTYYQTARQYLEATPYRVEEQKMAVVLQKIVGTQHEHYYYPNFAGVVRSYNYYPFGHMKPEDGVAMVALGLGQQVAEGGESFRFCPAHPQVLPQLGDPEQFLRHGQRSFYALDLNGPPDGPLADRHGSVVRLELDVAERHSTLAPIGSTYSPDDRAIYDGIHRPGVRLVTFAHILKSDLFPLAEILRRLLEVGREGMGGPVEIEFAVNLNTRPRQFGLLQLRPYGAGGEECDVCLDDVPRELMFCYSERAMGNDVIREIRDILYVKPEAFDAAKTAQIAAEIARFNERLRKDGRPYVLIGPGRWGSSNTWLGIPVNWAQISAARVIVETTLENFLVDPSQGSHFFHNLTSARVAYLTVNPQAGAGFVDWPWLASQPQQGETAFVRHVRTREPIEALIDGRHSRGALLKKPMHS